MKKVVSLLVRKFAEMAWVAGDQSCGRGGGDFDIGAAGRGRVCGTVPWSQDAILLRACDARVERVPAHPTGARLPWLQRRSEPFNG